MRFCWVVNNTSNRKQACEVEDNDKRYKSKQSRHLVDEYGNIVSIDVFITRCVHRHDRMPSLQICVIDEARL